MRDPHAEEPSVDARGIRPPSAYAIEARDAPADGFALYALTGELDIAAAPALRDLLAGLAGARAVVLDMTEVTFVDSSALRELLRADAGLRADGVPLVLAGLHKPVDRLLELTRTTGVLATEPSVAAAVRRLTQPVERP